MCGQTNRQPRYIADITWDNCGHRGLLRADALPERAALRRETGRSGRARHRFSGLDLRGFCRDLLPSPPRDERRSAGCAEARIRW